MLKKQLIFLLLLLVFLGLNCSSLNNRDERNYFHPKFVCLKEQGWRESDQFKRYLVNWLGFKEHYNNENKKIVSSDVVIAGNSLVHIFRDELIKQEFPNINMIGRGIGGDMTETFLARIEENVLSLNPKTIVIEIGGNDIIQGKCLSYIEKNVVQIIDKIKSKNSKTKIIFLSVPPTGDRHLNSVVPVYNNFLSGLPYKYSNVTYIDLWEEMRDPDRPTIKTDYIREKDKIHFNDAGYKVWGKLLRPHLAIYKK